jgi:hypothetical protein
MSKNSHFSEKCEFTKLRLFQQYIYEKIEMKSVAQMKASPVIDQQTHYLLSSFQSSTF